MVDKDGEVTTNRYIRDASGNVMAVYQDTLTLEHHIYGSSRLGLALEKSRPGQLKLGYRQYELSNHLGNVLAVITDNVNMVNSTENSQWYESKAWPTLVKTNDYYPFGLAMGGRTSGFSGNDSVAYRYGFNGKEKDQEGMGGGGSTYDYGFRIYNPRIAKFLSVDPLTSEYPWYTPYQFAGNTPIQAIDIDGLEPYPANGPKVWNNKIRTAEEFNNLANEAYHQIMHDNFIIKNESSGMHEFDKSRVRPILQSTIHNEGYTAALLQFKEMYGKAVAALELYDRDFFRGQLHNAQLQEEKERRAKYQQLQFDRKVREYQKAVEGGRIDAWVDIGLGGAGFVTSLFFFEANALSISGMLFSADLISGGYNKLKAIENGVFKTGKEYKFAKGMIIESTGESGAIVYDISSILVNSTNSMKAILKTVKNGKIRGEKLNSILGAAAETADTANTIGSHLD
jgi:RHS repeat-associated protein